jgi:hypothetical protein
LTPTTSMLRCKRCHISASRSGAHVDSETFPAAALREVRRFTDISRSVAQRRCGKSGDSQAFPAAALREVNRFTDISRTGAVARVSTERAAARPRAAAAWRVCDAPVSVSADRRELAVCFRACSSSMRCSPCSTRLRSTRSSQTSWATTAASTALSPVQTGKLSRSCFGAVPSCSTASSRSPVDVGAAAMPACWRACLRVQVRA